MLSINWLATDFASAPCAEHRRRNAFRCRPEAKNACALASKCLGRTRTMPRRPNKDSVPADTHAPPRALTPAVHIARDTRPSVQWP